MVTALANAKDVGVNSSKGAVLNSWKEIAAYLGRGVRTVQRYEHDLRLPVRRPRGTSRSAVIALTDELDSWLRTAPTSELRTGSKSQPKAVATMRQSIGAGAELRHQCNALREAHTRAVSDLITSLTGLMQEVHVRSRRRKTAGGR